MIRNRKAKCRLIFPRFPQCLFSWSECEMRDARCDSCRECSHVAFVIVHFSDPLAGDVWDPPPCPPSYNSQ